MRPVGFFGTVALLALTAPAVLAQPAAPPPLASIDQQALSIAREIIRIGFPEDQRAAIFGGASDAMSAQLRANMMRELDNNPGAKAIVNRYLDRFLADSKGVMAQHIPAIMDAMAVAYAREFSMVELNGILAFVRTPAGVHYLTRSAALLGDPAVAEANGAYIRDIQPLARKMREDMTAELTAYLVDHPPAPSKGS